MKGPVTYYVLFFIGAELPPEKPADGFRLEDVVCHESLGGLLKHYERRAA